MGTRRGITATLIIILIIIILIVLTVVLRNIYARSVSDFGTWTKSNNTLCLNEGQACTIEGISQRYRDCIPNSITGNGCIDSQGVHTYRREVLNVECTPICFETVWDTTTIQPCKVYTDITGTTPKDPQSCFTNPDCDGQSTCDSGFCTECSLPGEFRYEKIFRTCVANDTTGTNGCVKNDGSLALLGESETVLIPCGDIPECFEGNWLPCGAPCSTDGDCLGIQTCENNVCQPNNIQSFTCGTLASECGELLLAPITTKCQIGGQDVDISNCYPGDDPGPCETSCFNWPCSPFPSGFGNISAYQNEFLELFDNSSPTMFLVADFFSIITGLANDPLDTVLGSDIIVVNAIGHSFFENQVIGLQGVVGPNVNGIPITEINDFHFIQNVLANSFEIEVTTTATSTGSDGGNSVDTILSQEAIAQAQNQDVFAVGDVDITFSTVALDRVRLKIIPSQAEVANGAFYMIAHLPYSGQEGIVYWDGAKLIIKSRPIIGINQTFDDVLPVEDLFAFTTASAPFTLNTYLPGVPTLTPILVSFDALICTDSLGGTCI